MTEREMTIQGLRDLADFLTAHPDVPVSAHRITEFVDTRDEWDVINAAATWMEIHGDEFFVLRRPFLGGIVLEVNVDWGASALDDAAPAHPV